MLILHIWMHVCLCVCARAPVCVGWGGGGGGGGGVSWRGYCRVQCHAQSISSE